MKHEKHLLELITDDFIYIAEDAMEIKRTYTHDAELIEIRCRLIVVVSKAIIKTTKLLNIGSLSIRELSSNTIYQDDPSIV